MCCSDVNSNQYLCKYRKSLCVSFGSSTGEGAGGRSVVTDAEIKAVSETLYSLDSNKASASQLVIDTQVLVSNSQTSSQTDLSSQPWADYLTSTASSHWLLFFLMLKHSSLFFFCSFSLFRYLDEKTLFSRSTYAALLNLLDNYHRMTGTSESFSSQQLAEQETFLKATISNTKLGRELFTFLHSKGNSFKKSDSVGPTVPH